MNGLLLSVLILVFGLGLVAWFTRRYADLWFNILVNDKIELVDEILASEEPPARWRLPLLEQAAKHGPPSSLPHRLEPLLKRWYLYRLDKLIRSVRQSSVIRKNLKYEYLTGLKEIRAEWQASQEFFQEIKRTGDKL